MNLLNTFLLATSTGGVPFLVIIIILLFSVIRRQKGKDNLKLNNKIPSPTRLPLIGHLHLLDGEPFMEMTKLARTYGEIYFLQLGNINAVVVNSFRLIKQILVDKGEDFGNRANFRRYHILFGNDKENSLAFCDWSEVQKTRRSLARRFCHSGVLIDRLDEALDRAANWLTKTLSQGIGTNKFPSNLKMYLNKSCAIAFFGFFCSEFFDNDSNPDFDQVVRLFDDIFYEINQSHPTDVLPFLTPFFSQHLKNLAGMGINIRDFVLEKIINPHLKNLDTDNTDDFVDILLTHLKDTEPKSRLTLEQVLYELEDFIGGHSAVSNLLARALVEIASVPGLSEKIYQTCVNEVNGAYIRAVVYETLRKTSSPIVPHIASVDTKIDSYDIKKGTMVIFNNFDLNTNQEYWKNPEEFIPERFLTESGHFHKPTHFIPFSTGKRSCMGYKLVERATEALIIAIIRDYNIERSGTPKKMPTSCVALHPDFDLNIKLVYRNPV